ncbi:MAG: hypothetical protein A2161_10905 [Candidatus Schekmanbacteria bacterium RBG_13_48_7]|uniref:Bacterial type II secretion system protein E domain-containing protein n=1 Tax=Candidatus Schekmanbacteria bacterium RBG_13_48_7 TaxID=1817878 RepID=A0A1F7RQK7_9BACT|nr:MAG: hypothetical protein A2161_10905 [Candidatus Schekmanbacteria bacterium RBG_13_48_7]
MQRTSSITTYAVLVILAFFIIAALIILSGFDRTGILTKIYNLSKNPVFWSALAVILLLGLLNLARQKKSRIFTGSSSKRTVQIDPAEITGSRTVKLGKFKENLFSLLHQKKPDIINIMDFIISQAARRRASDIHFEPAVERVSLKYRIDGIMTDVIEIPKNLQDRLISRMKVMASLSIYKKNVPQDGGIRIKIDEKSYDIRASFLPTAHGEKAVLRLLKVGGVYFNLEELGFETDVLEKYLSIISRPNGTIFLTGPTGSGKTTTIYSSLLRVYEASGNSVNIVTIEDPIELDLGAFNQTQVNDSQGLTFAKGLRTILRQDPDVILVGEIRDRETAEIAVQAGLTGHLVFTTIHSDSAAGVFTRLIEMGMEPFLLASSTSAILAQRLVRKLCPHCKVPIIPSLAELKSIGLDVQTDITFYGSKGCDRCLERGYLGRIGLFELLILDEKIKEKVLQRVPTSELLRSAKENGMVTLLEDGITKVKKGITTLSELNRVISTV